MGKTIPVYFADDEMDLYEQIKKSCKHISRSSFMKIAALEKIEREENKQSTDNLFSGNKQGNNQFGDLLDKF